MKILVTGGAGFIGSHLCESFLKDGETVIAIDNLSTGNVDNISNIIDDKNFSFIDADILSYTELEDLIAEVDLVYHLAAAVGVELVVNSPVQTVITNVHGTGRILECAKKSKVKIVLTSTSEVYGRSEKFKFSEDDDLLIGSPYKLRWAYACSKLLDEFYCMAFAKEYDIPVIIARLFNTVGPRQTGQYGMVIPRFVSSALRNDVLKVYGTGEQTRSFCHVYDTVRALRLLGKSDISREIFNVGSRENISIYNLAEFIIDRLNSSSTIRFIPYSEAYEPGFEDMMHRYPNIDKIHFYVGWQPEKSLGDIIDDVANYMKDTDRV